MRPEDIQHRDQQASGKLEHLEKRGLIKIGKGGLPDDLWNMNRPMDKKAAGLAALIDERDGGR